jgi:hypothetical protein
LSRWKRSLPAVSSRDIRPAINCRVSAAGLRTIPTSRGVEAWRFRGNMSLSRSDIAQHLWFRSSARRALIAQPRCAGCRPVWARSVLGGPPSLAAIPPKPMRNHSSRKRDRSCTQAAAGSSAGVASVRSLTQFFPTGTSSLPLALAPGRPRGSAPADRSCSALGRRSFDLRWRCQPRESSSGKNDAMIGVKRSNPLDKTVLR